MSLGLEIGSVSCHGPAMTQPVTLPLWLFVLIVLFAVVTFASHFLFPSVRWFFRRRLERAVAKLNERLERPIQPFKLARRYDMVQRIIYDPEITQAIVEHAREEGVPENVAFEKARRYAREIVPSFSAVAYFGFAIRAARLLANALYRVRLGPGAKDALKDIDPDATVIFVMNHRSNMDYVLVTYLVAERSALSYAVGEWAQVWPLRTLIRSMGAYFIRRKSRNALYRKVLARYVQMATAGGVAQAVFPEGGLSLDGHLAPPKLGLLSYITDGARDIDRDVVFVPVALAYDRVLEDRILIAAGKAGNRKFPAKISVIAKSLMLQMWQRLRGTFYRFGYAMVNFGEPLSLNEASDDPKTLGIELMKRIGAAMPILPVPLICETLLQADGPLTEGALTAAITDRIAVLQSKGRVVHVPRDDIAYLIKAGLRQARLRKLIEETDAGIIGATGERDVLEFYAATLDDV